MRPEDAAAEDAAARARFGCDPAAEPQRFAKVCEDCAPADGDILPIGIPADYVVPEPGTITIAVITLSHDRINIGWLPELFNRPIPPEIPALIAERLRFYADKWESGALEARMRPYITINHAPRA